MILTAFLSQFVKGNGLLKTRAFKAPESAADIPAHVRVCLACLGTQNFTEWFCFSDCAIRGLNMHGFPVSEAVGEYGQFIALG